MDYEGQYSDRCGAPIVLHDLCSECKEHCGKLDLIADIAENEYKAEKSI